MKYITKIFALALVGFLLAGGTVYADGPFVKLGRGLTNLILSPAEIIYQPMEMDVRENSSVAWLGGVPKGILMFPVRAVVGVYDIVTFLIPLPKDYEAVMEPKTLVEGFQAL